MTFAEIFTGSILPLIAGLAFFLYGMNVMSKSLEKMAGGKLEHLLKKVTANPFVSFFLGAIITIAIQSSSATTVMLVGLVNSGIIAFSQTLTVIFGAKVGTTLTAWITSLSGIESDNFIISMLKPENFAPIVALIGIIMIMMSKTTKKKSIGTILIGFSIIMIGMNMMKDAASIVEEVEEIKNAFAHLDNSWLGLAVSTVFTAVIQSSAASVAMLQSLSVQGILTNAMVFPMVIGLNIGTCATALISCIGASKNAKRVAIFHLMVNILGMIICMPLFIVLRPMFADFFNANTDMWTIAAMHTLYNIAMTIVLMPFSKQIEKLVNFIVRDSKSVQDAEAFIDERLFRSPSVAIVECNNMALKMSSVAQDTIVMSIDNLYVADSKIRQTILDNEDRLDKFEDKLGTYLVTLSSRSLSEDDSKKTSKLLHTIGDFERIGDHAVNLLKVSDEMKEKNISFSETAKNEIEVLTSALKEILRITDSAFATNDLALASRVEPLEQVIDSLIAQIKSNHIERLQKGNCTIELGFVLNDLLTNYERISDHCSNIAVAIIETEHNSFATHKYLNRVKSFENRSFTDMFEEYRSQYTIE